MLSFLRYWAVLILGTAATVAGAVLLAQPRPASFGWFAYAPLSDAVFMPAPASGVYGTVLVGVGLVAISGWVGFRLGMRSRRRTPAQ